MKLKDRKNERVIKENGKWKVTTKKKSKNRAWYNNFEIIQYGMLPLDRENTFGNVNNIMLLMA